MSNEVKLVIDRVNLSLTNTEVIGVLDVVAHREGNLVMIGKTVRNADGTTYSAQTADVTKLVPILEGIIEGDRREEKEDNIAWVQVTPIWAAMMYLSGEVDRATLEASRDNTHGPESISFAMDLAGRPRLVVVKQDELGRDTYVSTRDSNGKVV